MEEVKNIGKVVGCLIAFLLLFYIVGNRNNSAQNKSNNWAFVAHRIGSVCPRLVQPMPKACSTDAHPSVRKGTCGGNGETMGGRILHHIFVKSISSAKCSKSTSL